MGFRELYQADFKAVEPRPELIAATRALYARQPRAAWTKRIPASALSMAACLLLAVGLCFGLPNGTASDAGNTAGNAALSTQSTAEDTEATPDIQLAAYADEAPAYMADNLPNRMATAPLSARTGTGELCSYPLLDKEYVADCVKRTDSDLRPTFALKLLQPARNHAVYLIRCGLWLTEYNISTTIYLY